MKKSGEAHIEAALCFFYFVVVENVVSVLLLADIRNSFEIAQIVHVVHGVGGGTAASARP